MKHQKQKSLKLLSVLVLLMGLNLTVSAQVLPGGYSTGKLTVGDPKSLINGNLTIASTGELFLGSDSPRGLKTNELSITGNYIGESGSQVFLSVKDNSNDLNTRGYIDISGTATKTDGATTIVLDMFDTGSGWDGSCISLVRAKQSGSDAETFRMDATPQINGRIAILRHREQGADVIWYIAEKLIRSQSTNAQASCLNGSFSALSVAAIPNCSYQWYRCDANGSNFVYLGDANGAQTAHFTPPVTAAGTNYYRCIVSSVACNTLGDSYNTDTTAISGAISVGTPVRIVTQPAREVIPAGSTDDVTLSVIAEGAGLTYQWYKNGIAIPGENTENLTVTSPDGDTADAYYVEITSVCGDKIQSQPASIGSCLDIIVQKRNHTLIVDNNRTYNGGYEFVYFDWFMNNEWLKSEAGGASGSVDKDGNYYKGGYYYTGGDYLNSAADYYAILLASDGKRYHTCNFRPVITFTNNITAYPIPLNASANYIVTVDAELSDEAIFDDAVIELYNAAGAYVSRTRATGRFTQVSLPSVAGVYVLVFKSSEIQKEIKVIVEK